MAGHTFGPRRERSMAGHNLAQRVANFVWHKPCVRAWLATPVAGFLGEGAPSYVCSATLDA